MLRFFIGMLVITLFPACQASEPGGEEPKREITILFLGSSDTTSKMINEIDYYIEGKDDVNEYKNIVIDENQAPNECKMHTAVGKVVLQGEKQRCIDLTLNMIKTPALIASNRTEVIKAIHKALHSSGIQVDLICIVPKNKEQYSQFGLLVNESLKRVFSEEDMDERVLIVELPDSIAQPGMTKQNNLKTIAANTINSIVRIKDRPNNSRPLVLSSYKDEDKQQRNKEVNILCLGYDDKDVNDNISGMVEMIGRYIKYGKGLGGWKPRKTKRGARIRRYNTMKGAGDYNGLAIKIITTPPLEQPNAKYKQNIKELHNYLYRCKVKIDIILLLIGESVNYFSEREKLESLSNELFGEDVTSYCSSLSTDEISYLRFSSEDPTIRSNALERLKGLVDNMNKQSFDSTSSRLMVENPYPEVEDDEIDEDGNEIDDDEDDDEVDDEDDNAGSGSYIKWIGGGVLVIGGVGLLYYAFKSKKDNKKASEDSKKA